MNTKRIFALITLAALMIPMYAGATWQDSSMSRAIWDSIRSSSWSPSEYVLTDADQRVIENAIVRIEAAIKSRGGESYRTKIVQQLQNAAKKYPSNSRIVAVVSKTVSQIESAGQPIQEAKTNWSCGQPVSYGDFSYSTKLMPDGNCWTTNLKHPSTIGDSWNYGDTTPNLPTNGTWSTYGRLYTWQSAMGLSGYQTVKDLTSTVKNVCEMLGDSWSIPSDAQWSSLEKVWATGWAGNKAFWLISKLPGTYYDGSDNGQTPSDNINYAGEWWTSTLATQYDSYVRYMVDGYVGMDRFYMTAHSGLSVVCINNKKILSTATGTTVVTDVQKSKIYTNVELLLNNGSKSLANLDMNGIKAIVADQANAKLLQSIITKLHTEFLTICKVGESGNYSTLTCSNEDAKNYVKYLYLATEAVIKYSSNETDRTYASGSIYAFRGTLHDMTPRSHYGEGDTMFFGFYGSDGIFNKVQIMVGWEKPESGNSDEKVVVFYATPDAPGFGQQHQYKKLDCISLFGCKKGEKIDGTIEN